MLVLGFGKRLGLDLVKTIGRTLGVGWYVVCTYSMQWFSLSKFSLRHKPPYTIQ